MKKLVLSLTLLGALFANNTNSGDVRFIALSATKNVQYAESFAKKVENKFKDNKYFDLVEVSTKGKNNFIYIRTKEINDTEAKVFLTDIKSVLKLKDAYYCKKQGCGFDVKRDVIKEADNVKATEVKMTLDDIIEKLSKE